jgi:hypothetical protein
MYPCRARRCKNKVLRKEEKVYRCPDCNSIFSIKWIERCRFKRRKKYVSKG